MQSTPSPLSDKIIFENSKYPINIRPHQSFHPYDPQNPSSIFHEEVEIKLILEGDYTLMINGDIYTVHPGDIVVINPYEHHYTIDTGTHGAIYNLYMLSLDFLRIYNPHAPDLRYTLLGEKICFLNIIRQNKRLQHILLSAQYEMAEQKENWQLILNNLMIEFFVILFREYINSDRINNVQITSLQYYDNILPALVYINANYAAKNKC